MKTLFLNPPSFTDFDGGAGSRWPARREIRSFWYPVWLAYPAGMLPESRLLDAPVHGVSPAETVAISRDFEFVVLFTSTTGFENDVALAEAMKDANPKIRVAFVGPHVSVSPEESLAASRAIDFVARGEFDYTVVEYARGKSLEDIAGVSFRENGAVRHTPERRTLTDLDSLPFAVEVYKRDLDITKYNIPFLKHPYVGFYTSRGCPARCTYCLWPQTFSGHAWRPRSAANVASEVRRAVELFPDMREIMFDDDTFTWGKTRVLDVCREIAPAGVTWSCNSRVHTDHETMCAMRDAGCRLLVVGFESASQEILNNIKKGITVGESRRFMKDARRAGLLVHGDFIIGLPGETRETIEETIRFAQELDCETIQVSIAHSFPGTEFHDWLVKGGYLTAPSDMTDECGHQLPAINYPHLSRREIVAAVEDFYGRYYFRPRVAWRIVRRALFDGDERRRLYGEARDYLRLRARRRRFVKGRDAA